MWLDQCFLTVGHAKRIYASWWQQKTWQLRSGTQLNKAQHLGLRFEDTDTHDFCTGSVSWSTVYCLTTLKNTIRMPQTSIWCKVAQQKKTWSSRRWSCGHGPIPPCVETDDPMIPEADKPNQEMIEFWRNSMDFWRILDGPAWCILMPCSINPTFEGVDRYSQTRVSHFLLYFLIETSISEICLPNISHMPGESELLPASSSSSQHRTPDLSGHCWDLALAVEVR